jgi:hypothetical protein
MSRARPVIRLRIDRLLLDGLTLGPGDAARFQRALVAELTAVLSDPGTGLSPDLVGGSFDRASPAPPIQLTPADPAASGRAAARGAMRGILRTVGKAE